MCGDPGQVMEGGREGGRSWLAASGTCLALGWDYWGTRGIHQVLALGRHRPEGELPHVGPQLDWSPRGYRGRPGRKGRSLQGDLCHLATC